jgi:transaldolase
MSLKSLIASGTKVWLDSIEPELVKKNRALGASGATSNPIIISDIIKAGHYDDTIIEHIDKGLTDEEIAWAMTDTLVKNAQQVFLPVWQETKGNNGYVSFELDPLLEDIKSTLPVADRTAKYIELGKKWAAGHHNRMIKVPATPGGLGALEALAAEGISLNVTLIFSERQYKIARGIVNAKNLWKLNQEFWKDKGLKLQQEIIFASTGTKKPTDPPDKYVEALAGSDIQTNPPATNDAVEKLNKNYTRKVDQLPPKPVLDEIAQKVDQQKMEDTLMSEGAAKFADPHHALLRQIGEKRKSLTAAK